MATMQDLWGLTVGFVGMAVLLIIHAIRTDRSRAKLADAIWVLEKKVDHLEDRNATYRSWVRTSDKRIAELEEKVAMTRLGGGPYR